MPDTARHRLALAMEDRRLELGLKWREVAERANMTPFHLQRIRSDKVALTTDAAAAIERALEWEPGSVQAILDGGDPQPRATAPTPQTDEEERARMIKELGELRAKLDTALRRLDELEGRGEPPKSA